MSLSKAPLTVTDMLVVSRIPHNAPFLVLHVCLCAIQVADIYLWLVVLSNVS